MPTKDASQLMAGPVLPQATRNLLGEVGVERRHAGLQLNKLSAAGEMVDQKSVLGDVIRTLRDEPLLQDLLAGHRSMLDALGAARLPMTTRGPLTLHLSRSGALENAGIALHPIYGFVYLPGSGIKGLTRAWAETVWAPAQADNEKAWRQIEKAFGWSPRSEHHKRGWRPREIEPQERASAGRLVFHDAWPLRWPSLIVDVVNNHHPDYYDGKYDPGDWENPKPVYFLTVGAGEKFEFSISDRKQEQDGNGLLETACGWLRDALTVEGAGAKTAAGYGHFKPTESNQDVTPPSQIVSKRFNLRLATPAFLAGADQKKEDCDLRPATLRGLLRWWWRTMHAGHLDLDSLRGLETAVWGDSQSGSPVRIAVDSVNGEKPEQHPEQYNKHDTQFRNLPRPERGQKVTQGLFYASYGMAEGKERDRWRWFRPAGSCWRVTLTVRSGRFTTGAGENIRLSPDRLLGQATSALWLLTRFGGAGSRSRKGFGSFDDIPVQDIGSIEDCINAAARFREDCKLNARQGQPVQTPALEEALILERHTAWNDPWYALDQTGMVLQLFTKNLNAEKRVALGLPRRVGQGRDARSLEGSGGIDRHASPALWSLATRQDETLLVRLIAFPAARLPDKAASKIILQKLIDFAIQELNQRAERSPSIGGRGRLGPSGTGRTDTRSRQADSSRPPQSGPRANDRVMAELLEEKTKRGGWKAKHVDSGLEGPIQDSQNVPADAEPGQRVELTVASTSSTGMQFKWALPPAPKRTPRQGGGSESRGRWRGDYR